MFDVILPKMGMSVTESTITDWKVKVGDKVKAGGPLVEVEMEKVTTVLESAVAGTVKEILAKEGDIVPVGSTICIIEED